MLKSAFLILLVLSISIVAGSASVWYALKANEGMGAVVVGQWTAFPNVGTTEADPYSRARVAREGLLALGRAEGLSFSATRDTGGDPLRRECTYLIEGPVPPARFWTLYVTDQSGSVVKGSEHRPASLHSYQLIRLSDNSIAISVGAHPAPGNWLALSGKGPATFMLNLFDTPIASGTGAADVVLPQIAKVGCDV
ncbi:DUF1214 domain-containing protein [Mesorhizobium sp. VNQ89]|uniref:DUF1214 domain-containing protein n=1 Tax=Mesorhizobium quangtriensis TaxID=3157709 RepID=UPI0032B76838